MAWFSRRLFVQQVCSLGAMSYVQAPAACQRLFRKVRSPNLLRSLTNPVLLAGDATTAYRDPAAIYHDGYFYLFYTLVVTGSDGIPCSCVAWSKSKDLREWTSPAVITEKNRALGYSSPGDIVRVDGKWVLCLQTYPRPNGEKFANANARIWTMTSKDLEHWESPELLRVSGPEVSAQAMGRMIDPYLLQDKDHPGVWWCLYKERSGIQISRSTDLKTWTALGSVSTGENPCVIVDQNDYVLFYSPENGIGVDSACVPVRSSSMGNIRNWPESDSSSRSRTSNDRPAHRAPPPLSPATAMRSRGIPRVTASLCIHCSAA